MIIKSLHKTKHRIRVETIRNNPVFSTPRVLRALFDSSGPSRTSESLSAAATSEIAAANYAARALGVRAGWRLGRAREHCGGAATLIACPYDFDAYRATSLALYATLFRFTHGVEILSCDEGTNA